MTRLMLALAAVLLLAACGGSGEPSGSAEGSLRGSVTVFAAASLTDAFSEIGEAFEAENPNVEVAFNFAGSAALRAQIEEGAPADVFASANTSHMDTLLEAGLAEEATIFVHNSLVVITPSGNPAGISSLTDLQNPGLKLVLAAPEVPVGGYAREMLQNANADREFGAGFSEAVLANLVSNESNVKQVVAKVELGEADAGIVYGSDVTRSMASELQVIEVPDFVNVIANYAIATLEEAGSMEVAQAFVSFVLSSQGQAILAKWSFRTSV